MGLRFVALDSWRGICALVVALFHFPILGLVKGSPVVAHGFLFVDFFFVLSGFVIAHAYESRANDDHAPWRFLIRRFGRLWPLHVAILALFVLASVIGGDFNADERHSLEAVITNLAMVHGLGVHRDLTWNGPSWSISVEFMLYLLFALLAPMQRKAAIYAFLVLAGLAVLILEAPAGMGSTFDYGAFRGLAGFFTGALVAGLPRRAFGTLAEVLTVAMVVAFVGAGAGMFAAPFVFGLAVYVFSGSDGVLGRALLLKPFVRLGEWSYSIYMVHAMVVSAIWGFAGPLGLGRDGGHLLATSPGHEALICAGYLAVIVAASALAFRFVEEPCRDFFNRIAMFRTSKAAAPTS